VAIGGGVEIALACDRIVASRRASFCLPETSLGIYPGLGGTQRLPRKIGVGLAKWMIFTGKTLSTGDAAKIGLVDELVANEEIGDVARFVVSAPPRRKEPRATPPEFAAVERFFLDHSVADIYRGAADAAGEPTLLRAMKQVAAKAPIGLQYAESLIDEGMRRTLAEGLQLEIDRVLGIYATRDAYLGLSSRNGRQIAPPTFTGK
jgi:enoyl-CoA hydratase/carnithine racemase